MLIAKILIENKVKNSRQSTSAKKENNLEFRKYMKEELQNYNQLHEPAKLLKSSRVISHSQILERMEINKNSQQEKRKSTSEQEQLFTELQNRSEKYYQNYFLEVLFGFDVNLNKQKLPIMKGLPPPVKNKSPTPMSDGVYTIYGLDKVESLPPEFAEISRESLKSMQSEKEQLEHEKWYHIVFQVSVPFFIAGIGTIGAGLVMAMVTKYDVFKDIKALLVLIPALLGLKGNLDMCLASRLSTQANLGNMSSYRELSKMIIGNLLLVQIQAIVASCVVAVFATGVSALLNGNFRWINTLFLATSSTLTATTSCFILDLVLVTVIVLSHKINLNPDNMATPMAASIGDVVSLIVLSSWAQLLYNVQDDYPWLMAVILSIYVFILLPIWVAIVRKNKYTKKVLTQGWTPVISALFISGTGGVVLDMAVDLFNGYEIFQPIINGIGGNLVSVQASRISTMFHKTAIKGFIPAHTKQWVSPFKALISGVLPAKTARLLFLISIPGHTVFVFAADYIYNGVSTLRVSFVLTYLVVGFVQLVILLYVCHIMTHTLWKFKIDPDNASIPYLTALGDISGSTLLLLAFMFLRWINEEYEPVK